jgi:hypothetical protein
MDASGINTVSELGGREASARVGLGAGKAITGQPPEGSPIEDTVELSRAGIALSRGDVQSPPQFARMCEIRAAIKAGTFETPERLDETVKRLLKVIG